MSASKQDFPSKLLYTPEGQAYELKDLMWYPYPSSSRDTVEIVIPMTDVTAPVGSMVYHVENDILLRCKREEGWVDGDEHVIAQDPYRSLSGNAPDVGTVYFYVPVCDAETGQVNNPDCTAFDGTFRDEAVGEKYSIRILPSGGHHSGHHKHHKIQYNLARQREPITRARLAMDVFEELVKIWPDRVWHDSTGVGVPFEHLILVHVKCKSRKSVQPTFTYRAPSLSLAC